MKINENKGNKGTILAGVQQECHISEVTQRAYTHLFLLFISLCLFILFFWEAVALLNRGNEEAE